MQRAAGNGSSICMIQCVQHLLLIFQRVFQVVLEKKGAVEELEAATARVNQLQGVVSQLQREKEANSASSTANALAAREEELQEERARVIRIRESMQQVVL